MVTLIMSHQRAIHLQIRGPVAGLGVMPCTSAIYASPADSFQTSELVQFGNAGRRTGRNHVGTISRHFQPCPGESLQVSHGVLLGSDFEMC